MNKKLTLSLVSLAVAGVLSPAATAGVNDIIITEYMEGLSYGEDGYGSNTNRAIEITNRGGEAFNFDANNIVLVYSSYDNMVYKPTAVKVDANSDGKVDYKDESVNDSIANSALNGVTIPAGGNIVLVPSEAEQNLKDAITAKGAGILVETASFSEQGHNSLNFDGNDAVWLADLSDKDAPIDIIGENSEWGRNKTFRRSDTAMTQNAEESKGSNTVVEVTDGYQNYTDLGTDDNADSYLVQPEPAFDISSCEGLSESNTHSYVAGGKVKIEDIQGQLRLSDESDPESKTDRSPLLQDGQYTTNDRYAVQGVVTGVIEPGLSNNYAEGFYIEQYFATDADDNKLISNGLYVKTSKAEKAKPDTGKTVCIVGNVGEKYGMTVIYPDSDNWQVLDDPTVAIKTTDLELHADDETFSDTLERHEGMHINLPQDIDPSEVGAQDMRVTRNYGFNASYDELYSYVFRDNMTLSYERPNMHPNMENVPGSDASIAADADNKDRTLYVGLNEGGEVECDECETEGENLTAYFEELAPQAKLVALPTDDHRVRINDSIYGLTGFMHYSRDYFRLLADVTQTDVEYVVNTPIQTNIYKDGAAEKIVSAEPKDADTQFVVKVATQNVLNYFNSPFGGDENSQRQNRGAMSAEEFERQEDKIVKAIQTIDADVVGLMEIENNGYGDNGAIASLVTKINEKYTEDDKYPLPGGKVQNDEAVALSVTNKYVFVGFDSNGDTILNADDRAGGDAISSGILYRPHVLSLKGSKIIKMPSQNASPIVDENGTALITSRDNTIREDGKNYMRDTVTARFQVNRTGKSFTIAVNHLKSKGSTCWEDWQGWETWGWSEADATNKYKTVKDDDFQGNCENFRVAGAVRLGEEMARIKGDKILLGDFNAYAKEDPMRVLTDLEGGSVKAAAYTNIGDIKQFGENGATITKSYGYANAMEYVEAIKREEARVAKAIAEDRNIYDVSINEIPKKPVWSYSFGDQIGSLDHILISDSLKKHIVDAGDWHSNSVEASFYSYTNEYTEKEGNVVEHKYYKDNVFRASDHDPAIMTLAYTYGEAGDSKVTLPIVKNIATVSYVIPESIDLSKYTDIVGEISSLSNPSDAIDLTLPMVEVDENDKIVHFHVSGATKGAYTFEVKLRGVEIPEEDEAQVQADETSVDETPVVVDIPNSAMTMEVEIAKTDSLTASPVAPEYDGTGGSSGGSLGIFSLLSLFGFGFYRRRKNA